MRLCAFAICILAALLMSLPAMAAVRIANDNGGRIDRYLYKFSALRASGERVIIDGACLSACTLVLGAVPRERICVTPRARLGFHAAWQFTDMGRRRVHSASGTRFLMDLYPQHVRQWISRKGGLKSHMIFLHGRELAAMYPRCF